MMINKLCSPRESRKDFTAFFFNAAAVVALAIGSVAALGVSTAAAQKMLAVHDVQGSKNVSPLAGERIRTGGIVTARTRSGFYLQTPDDRADADPNTSEGIFVYTKTEPPVEATIGNLISLTGTVDEFRPKADPLTLPTTNLSLMKGEDIITVESKGNRLPKPIALTAADFTPNAIDQLEKYEGMRVAVPELTVVAPTNGRVDIKNTSSESDGVFYGVLKNLPRPFREPGFDTYDYQVMPEKERSKMLKDYPKIAVFDHNPERLRIESAGQLGAQAIDVPVNAEIKNLVGVMNYGYRAYSILVDPDNKPAISKIVKSKPLPPATAQQLSVAGLNVENFFDDEDDPAMKEDILTTDGFQRKSAKISLAIRRIMQSPDVVGIIEAENLTTLKKLADKINADAAASGEPNPKYEAYLTEGNDGRGIDSGFLVKSARVKVLEVKQFGKEEKYENPVSGKETYLNDRPPLMLRAAVNNFEFTVIVNHLKSFNGYNDEKDAPNVRLKKRLQAEFLARLVADRIKANPAERIALIGDFNAYQFTDGITDIIGTIKGTPAPKNSVINVSADLLDPDLTDLVDALKPEDRYSYSFDGNAQVLDHFLVNDNFKKHVVGFGYARINADFPEIYRNDAARPERFSDHDAAVAYFSLNDPARTVEKK